MVCCPSPKSYRINLSLFPIANTRTFSSSLCILFSCDSTEYLPLPGISLTLTIGLILCHSSNSWKFLLNYVQLGLTQRVFFQPSAVGRYVCSPHYSQRSCPPMHCHLNTFGWQPEPRSSCPLLSPEPPSCFSRCLPLMFCQDLSLISPQTTLLTCLPSHCPILGL